MKGNVDKVLKKKIEEIEVPDGTFDYSFIDTKSNKRSSNLKLVFVMILSFLMFIIGFSIFLNFDIEKDEPIEDVIVNGDNEYKDIIDNIVGTEKIEFTIVSNETEYIDECEAVYIVKVSDMSEYDLYTNINELPPKLKIKCEVIDTIKGEREEIIEFYVPYGIVSIKTLNASGYLYEKEKYSNINRDKYIRIIYSNGVTISEPVVQKIYIVSLEKDKNNELKAKLNVMFGFKELDIENNLVKNQDDEWEIFDINKMKRPE